MSTAYVEAAEQARLLTILADLGIDAHIVPYPAHTTVEEGKRLRGDLSGTFTKNLLLRDKKGSLYFVTAHEDTDIDLRTLHTKIQARGRLGFAPPEVILDRLHVRAGTATPLALFNDTDHEIALIVDAQLRNATQLNFHPMVHTESIGLSWDDFLRFTHTTGHEPILTNVSAT
jgi:Ala-tRNA(Pro) deacylase